MSDTSRGPSDDSLRREMENIIRTADIESMTIKKFIKELSEMGIDMKYRKKYVKEILPEILDTISRESDDIRQQMENIVRTSDTESMSIKTFTKNIDLKHRKKYIRDTLSETLNTVSSASNDGDVDLEQAEDKKEQSKTKADETSTESWPPRPPNEKVCRTDSYKSFAKFLQRDQMMQDSLNDIDHIISLGYQILLDKSRLRAYIGSDEMGGGEDSQDSTATQQETDAATVAFHTEDRQIYSNLQNVDYCVCDRSAVQRGKALPIFKWPMDFNAIQRRNCSNSNSTDELIPTSKRKPNVDSGWEFYYGDGINDADFRQKYCSKKRRIEIGKSNKFLPPSATNDDDTVDNSRKSLHDLIQRSWDKAVHVAGCALSASKNNEDNLRTGGAHKNGTQNNSSDLSCQAAAVVKCKELEISFAHINVINNRYMCECCRNSFQYVSNKEVIRHLFGSQNRRGCCWKVIEEKQQKLAMKILERETVSIIDNLLQIVFKKIKRKCEDKQNEHRHEQIGWKEVYEEMTCALGRSLKYQNDDKVRLPEGLETLQTDVNLMPFPLNDNILEIVLSRLVTRYVDDDNIK